MPKPPKDEQDVTATPAGPLSAAQVETPTTSGNPLLAGLGAVQPVQLAAPRRRAPVFDDAVVIYLGTRRNMSVALRGNLSVMKAEEYDAQTDKVREIVLKEIPEDGGDGITSYDFTTHDIVGRLIRERLVPRDHPTLGMYAGKAVQRVEHPDHLFHFYRAGGGQEFAVVVPQHRIQEMQAYFLERARAARAHEDEVASIVANATQSAA